MSKQEVILCEDLESSLKRAIDNCPHDRLFILTDDHTHRLCLSQLAGLSILKDAVEITIGAEDVHKTMETLASVWMKKALPVTRSSSISGAEWSLI